MRLKSLSVAVGLLFSFQIWIRADIAIMPLGDSITYGAHGHAAGYRYPLLVDLTQAGIAFHYLGQCTDNCMPLPYPSQWHHNGYPGATISDIVNNLAGNVKGPAMVVPTLGGYWMTSGKPDGEAVNPDLVLLMIGTNNLIHPMGQGGTDLATMESDFTTLINWFTKNRPTTMILIGTVVPITNGPATRNETVIAFNEWLKTSLPTFGPKCSLIDLYKRFLKPDGTPDAHLFSDGIHPTLEGYALMAQAWSDSIKAMVDLGIFKKETPVAFGDSFALPADKQVPVPTLGNILLTPASSPAGGAISLATVLDVGNNTLTAPTISFALKDAKGKSVDGMVFPAPLNLGNLAPHANNPVNITFKLPDKIEPGTYTVIVTEKAAEGQASVQLGGQITVTP